MLHQLLITFLVLLSFSTSLQSGLSPFASVLPKYDVIVAGSGIGGLSAGAKLARASKKVLVVEQHSVPGGCVQTLHQVSSTTGQEYNMPVGMHYLIGTPISEIFELVTGISYSFTPLDPGYNLAYFPTTSEEELSVEEKKKKDILSFFNTTISEQSSADWTNQLLQLFPECHSEIQKYASDSKKKPCPANKLSTTQYLAQTFDSCPDTQARVGILKSLVSLNIMDLGDTGQTATWCFEDPFERLYMKHGMVYPSKGPGGFVDSMTQLIEDAGGKVITDTRVVHINTAGNAVTGVVIEQEKDVGKKKKKTERQQMIVNATNVVSDMGIKVTFDSNMMDPDLLKKYGYLNFAKEAKLSMPLAISWLTFNETDKNLGFPNKNVFFSRVSDYIGTLDNMVNQPIYSKKTDEFPMYLAAFLSGREPEVVGQKRQSYVALMMPCPFHWFTQWENSSIGHRPEAYTEWVNEYIIAKSRTAFYEHFPQAEASEDLVIGWSPLTLRDVLNAPGGTQCGVTREYEPSEVFTKIDGLYLVGKDLGCGVQPSAFTGFEAAALILVGEEE